MSKLQALAASRKKKAEESKGIAFHSRAEGKGSKSSVSLLEKLSTQTSTDQSLRQGEVGTSSKLLALRSGPKQRQKDSINDSEAESDNENAEPNSPTKISAIKQPKQARVILPRDVQAQPSEFARAMLGNTNEAEDSPAPAHLFSMPYADAADINELKAFAGPSPDDIVTTAQSKGSTTFRKSKVPT